MQRGSGCYSQICMYSSARAKSVGVTLKLKESGMVQLSAPSYRGLLQGGLQLSLPIASLRKSM